jgi:hypothetical protein
VMVDLTTKGVALAVLSAAGPQTIVPPISRTFLISDALQQTQTQVAINANLFSACCTYGGGETTALLGLAYTNHAMWSPIGNIPPKPTPPPPGNFLSSLIVADGRVSIVTLKKGQKLPPGLTLAVTGTHRILTGGKNTAPTDTSLSWFDPTARTVVGYSVAPNDKQQLIAPRLWLVAVDASNGSYGVTLPQAANLLLSLGATDAINLDGGGSTTMVRQEPNGAFSFINTPKDWAPEGQTCRVAKVKDKSCERYVGFGLAVVAPPLP